MNRSRRTAWTAALLGAACVFGLTGERTSRAQAAGVAPGPAEPPERNCWDPSRHQGPGDAPPPMAGSEDVNDAPTFRAHQFTSNRGHGIPVGTMQVVTFYDGETVSRPTLRIEYDRPQGRGWIEIGGIKSSTSGSGHIGTWEYHLGTAIPTGRIRVSGVVPNGVIDGLAFGLLWRDANGYHILRSTAPVPSQHAALVGMWPIALNDASIERRTPQLATAAARQQTRMIVSGAEYLDNGEYALAIQERAVLVQRRANAE